MKKLGVAAGALCLFVVGWTVREYFDRVATRRTGVSAMKTAAMATAEIRRRIPSTDDESRVWVTNEADIAAARVTMLVGLSTNESESWRTRLDAVSAMARIDTNGVLNHLISALEHECAMDRKDMSPRVGRSYGSEDEALEMRTLNELVWFVGNSKDNAAHIRTVRDWMLTAKNPKLRYWLGEVLARCHDTNAVPVLIECLESAASGEMRASAASSLGKLGDKSAERALRKALQDEYVSFGMGDLKGPRGRPVRVAAALSLRNLGFTVIKKGKRGEEEYEVAD